MRKSIVKLGIVAAVILVALPSMAQRTMPGQFFVDVEGHYRPGAEIGVGSYQPIGFWRTSLEGFRHVRRFNNESGDRFEYLHLFAQGEYMFRLVGTYTRSVNLYAGAGALLGMELVDPWKKVPSTIYWEHQKTKFMYGVSARVEGEFFLGKVVSIIVSCQAPLTLGSQYTVFGVNGGLGLRFSI